MRLLIKTCTKNDIEIRAIAIEHALIGVDMGFFGLPEHQPNDVAAGRYLASTDDGHAISRSCWIDPSGQLF